MKKALLLKPMLLLFALIVGSSSVWADGEYTITFSNNVNSATAISSSTTAAVTIATASRVYVTNKPFTLNSGNAYYGDTKTSIRVGKSGNAASLTIALSDEGKVKAKSIVVNCRAYNSTNMGTLNVNSLGAQDVPSSEGDLTFSFANSTDISSITLAVTKPTLIYSITVNYESYDASKYGGYELVTDASTLETGDKLLIVTESDKYAMGVQNENNRGVVSVNISDHTITNIPTNVAVVTLEGSSGAWNLKTNDGYLYAAASGANQLKSRAEVGTDGNATATITISSSNSNATIQFQGTNRGLLRYNPNTSNNNPLFSCYASNSTTGSLPQIYRYFEPTHLKVTVGTYKWATFCCSKPLDFTDTNVKAYIVTGFNGNSITKKEVKKVPAETGLLLNAESGQYDIPVTEETLDDVSENNLQPVLTGSVTVNEGTNGNVNYVLTVQSGQVVFAWIGGTPATVTAGKAYLTLEGGPTPGSNAPWLSIDGDEETTGIQNVERTINDNQYYTLDGRRVAEPTKGLYIINGKKVVVK